MELARAVLLLRTSTVVLPDAWPVCSTRADAASEVRAEDVTSAAYEAGRPVATSVLTFSIVVPPVAS
eukprot:6357572-Prymnesium_polylepis.1